uniref:THO complex subunit 3-like n=1 Tax=Callorhinchus milii TaxID=7868 RepID=A0A4W3HC37_CALMI
MDEADSASREPEEGTETAQDQRSPTPPPEKTYGELKIRFHVPLSRDSRNIFSVVFSPSGNELVVGFGNGAVQSLKPATGKVIRDIFSGGVARQATTSMCFHPTEPNYLIAVGAEGIISVYKTDVAKCIATMKEEGNQLNAVDISSDGGYYATGGKSRGICIYDVKTNQVTHVLEPADYVTSGKDLQPIDGHSRRIYALRFHPQERHIFLSGGWDDSVKVWDKRMEKQARRVLNGPHICGPGIDIWDNKILTASWVAQDALQLWDFRRWEVEKNIPFLSRQNQGDFLYAARFCNRDIVMAGGSGTNSAKAINHKTSEVRITPISRVVQAGKAAGKLARQRYQWL